MSILIKDTIKEQREKIVAESIRDTNGTRNGCMAGLNEMYQDYIEKREEFYLVSLKIEK